MPTYSDEDRMAQWVTGRPVRVITQEMVDALINQKEGDPDPITEIIFKKNHEGLSTQEQTLRDECFTLFRSDEKNKTEKVADAITEYVVKNTPFYTLIDDKIDEYWYYEDGIFQPNGKCFIRAFIYKILKEYTSETVISVVMKNLKNRTLIKRDDFFREANPNYICVRNGIFDLRMGVLWPHSPEQRFFSKLPIKYDKDAKCPKITSFLLDSLPSEEVDRLLEMFGSVMYRSASISKATMLQGDGANAKSKILELLTRLVGEENISFIPLEKLAKDQFSTSQLQGKMANIYSEDSSKIIEDAGVIKAITGGDTITANRKNLPYVTFKPYAKLFFSSNDLPVIDSEGNFSFWRRWQLFLFTKKYVPRHIYDSLEVREREKVGVADPHIIDKIATPEELSGLLNLCLEKLKKVVEHGYTEEVKWETLRNLWVRRSDSFTAFLQDCTYFCSGGRVSKEELQERYFLYCKKRKLRIMKKKHRNEVLETVAGAEEGRYLINGEREYGYANIAFRPDGNTGLSEYISQA